MAGANEFVITDVTNVEQLVEAMSAIHQRGAGVSLDARVEQRIKDRERGAYSKQRPVRVRSLPEDGKFTVQFMRPIYGRGETVGIYRESTLASMDFNGKWHFVNWWKRATSMGKDRHGEWQIDLGDGKGFVPLDADAMKNWKMSPPRARKSTEELRMEEWKATQEQLRAIRDIHDSMAPTGDYYQNQQARNKATLKAAVELFGEEEVNSKKEVLQYGHEHLSLNNFTREQMNQLRL